MDERFSTLVNPGRPIPPVVTDLTGIDDRMVSESPDIEQALARFVDFAGQDVLVAHNAPFDLRFLNYERRRLWGRYFTQPWLDTLVLARRLLNGRVARHDLGDARRLGRHGRAPEPPRPARRRGHRRGAGAADRPARRARRRHARRGRSRSAASAGARHAYKLALAEDLPTGPGVYVMRDREGNALYVGKAANLRRRVRSYFGPGGRHGRLIGRALEQLDSIDHETCGSEFAALLRENALIKEPAPALQQAGDGRAGATTSSSAARPAGRASSSSRASARTGPPTSARCARSA